MRRFKSVGQAQHFLNSHAAVSNLFNIGRHLVSAVHYRDLREAAFREWERAVDRYFVIDLIDLAELTCQFPMILLNSEAKN